MVTVVTLEEHAADIAALRREFLGLLGAYVGKHERWLPTAEAMETAQISRDTLWRSRASAPEAYEPGRITYRKEDKKCWYLLSSCIDYARNKQGLPALRA